MLPDLITAASDADTVTVEWRYASALHTSDVVGDGQITTSLRGWGTMDVRSGPGMIVCSLPEVATPAAIVHPLTTLPLAFLSHWRGRTTLHGGAFLHGGRAWLVVGEQMAGKSSTLVRLAQRGIPILADDLIVVDAGDLLAGPSCVDLRPDVAARVPGTRPLGVVAGRDRFRFSTPPGPARVPVGGLFVLEWTSGGAAEFSPLDLGEHLQALHTHHYAGMLGPPHPGPLMTMLSFPAWRARRPRDWAAAEAAIDQLLARAS